MSNSIQRKVKRRSILKSGITTAGVLSVAGCIGSGNNSGGNNSNNANSKEFPSETVSIIVPYSTGGFTDTMARLVADPLGEELGTSVEVENIPGAATLRGLGQLANRPSDGHHIGMASLPGFGSTVLLNQSDLKPTNFVGLAFSAEIPTTWFGNKSHNFKGFKDVIERYNNGEFTNVQGLGLGQTFSLVAYLLRNDPPDGVGWKWREWVSYDGASPGIKAVAQNEVPFGLTGNAITSYYGDENDNIDIIGTMRSDGHPGMPDVPSWTDKGFENRDNVAVISQSFMAPPGLGENVRGRLEDALEVALTSNSVKKYKKESGNIAGYLGNGDDVDSKLNQLMDTWPNKLNLEELREDAGN